MPSWPQVAIWPKNYDKKDLNHLLLLLDELSNPHKKLPPTIHVAGTNGKGSTVAMLRSIFERAGYRVHTYTSPHLLEFNERITLAGNNISDYHLFELLDRVRLKAEALKIELGFFEGTTMAAFLAFSSVPADILILETGMGGRLDATNVIEEPILTIITPISLDHVDYLGDSILQIATEKAGIVKNNVPCVISSQREEVYQLLFNKCEEVNSPVFCYEYDYVIEKSEEELIYRSQKYNLKIPYPSLRGEHQYINASAVIASVMLINDIFKISNEVIANGIKNTYWPARIEKIEPEKYKHLACSNVSIYVDGAHNTAGAKVLTEWIKDYLKDEIVYLIIGMTKNRNIQEFCQYFDGLIEEGRAVKVMSEPSSYHPDVISDVFKKNGFNFKSASLLEDAIKELGNLSLDKKSTIIVTGSLFLASDFYKIFI